LEDPGIDRRIILKGFLNTGVGIMKTELMSQDREMR
jgi:hypothetical protein